MCSVRYFSSSFRLFSESNCQQDAGQPQMQNLSQLNVEPRIFISSLSCKFAIQIASNSFLCMSASKKARRKSAAAREQAGGEPVEEHVLFGPPAPGALPRPDKTAETTSDIDSLQSFLQVRNTCFFVVLFFCLLCFFFCSSLRRR